MKVLNSHIDFAGKKVLVRCDLDVPIENGKILETYRLEAALPTLQFLQKLRAQIIIAGHMGKPDGKVVPELSTQHLLPFFNEKLGKNTFELLENLRFDPREESNDDEYAKELASNADYFVNESFATSHRKHTSIVGIPKYLPHYAGLRFEQEIENLSKVLQNPAHPFVAIIGGAKLESKKPVVAKFLQIADHVLLGQKLGLDWHEAVPDNLQLPIDELNLEGDIGPQTTLKYKEIIASAKTIVWAGPMGIFENPTYEKGTKEIAQAIAQVNAFKVAGGGNTVDAINRYHIADKINFISTGGSAMLEYLATETLPGLEALS